MVLLKAGGYASIIVCLILLIRKISFKTASKRFFMVMWMVATIRFLFVFELPLAINIFNIKSNIIVSEMSGTTSTSIIDSKPINLDSVAQNATSVSNDNINHSASSNSHEDKKHEINTSKIFEIVYFSGVAAAALTILILYVLSLRKINGGLEINDEYISEIIAEYKRKRKVRVIGLDNINTAFTYGIFKLTIVVPMDFWMMEKSRQKIVIEHEMMHIASGDYLKQLLIEAVIVLHWFNPFAYLLFIFAKQDMEYYCDERIVLKYGDGIKKEYALTIMEVATGKPYSLKLYNAFGYKDIKNRITTVMNTKRVTKRAKINCNILLSIGIVLTFITGCTAITVRSDENGIGEESKTALESTEKTTETEATTVENTEVEEMSEIDRIRKQIEKALFNQSPGVSVYQTFSEDDVFVYNGVRYQGMSHKVYKGELLYNTVTNKELFKECLKEKGYEVEKFDWHYIDAPLLLENGDCNFDYIENAEAYIYIDTKNDRKYALIEFKNSDGSIIHIDAHASGGDLSATRELLRFIDGEVYYTGEGIDKNYTPKENLDYLIYGEEIIRISKDDAPECFSPFLVSALSDEEYIEFSQPIEAWNEDVLAAVATVHKGEDIEYYLFINRVF